MQMTRHGRAWACLEFLVCFVFLSTGCTHSHSTYLSDQWIEQPQGFYQTSINHHRPTLQVIITYDGLLSNHAALRLVGNHGKVTFWDPAGAYGLRSPSSEDVGIAQQVGIQRMKDLVVTQIPDLPTYVQFRWYVGDVTVEVFEWDLAPQDATSLEEILRDGFQAGSDTPVFHTETTPAFCAVAISEFLQRFAGSILTLPDWYLWPHSLAQALLEQAPIRIRVFQRNTNEITYVSPHRSAGRPHALTELVHQ